jgi:hypothetical protein
MRLRHAPVQHPYTRNPSYTPNVIHQWDSRLGGPVAKDNAGGLDLAS